MADTPSEFKRAEPIEGSDPWISLPTAGRILGESRVKVLARVATKELEATQVADRIFVSRESVARVREQKDAAAVLPQAV